MNTAILGLLFLHFLVFLRASLGASTAERARTSPAVGAVFQSPRTEYQRGEDEFNYSIEEEQSGDYEADYPRVGFSSKPKDSSVIPITQNRRKGRGRKNPCLKKKYRGYCIHGTCQYLETLNHTSCICELGYSGERCHIFILPVSKEVEGYNQTTALAVIAVILSMMCLTFIGILLAFRCYKKDDSNLDSEEKIKLESATVQ